MGLPSSTSPSTDSSGSPPADSGASVEAAVEATSLVAWARDRLRIDRSDAGWATQLAATGFLLIAIGWPLFGVDRPGSGLAGLGLAVAAYVVVQAVAASVEFEIGPGFGIPTSAVMGVAVFTVPPALIPLSVLAGMGLASAVAGWRQPDRRESVAALAMSAWHGVGPAAVVALFGLHGWSLATVAVAGTALVAQVGLDFAAAWIRNCLDHGVDPAALTASFRFTAVIDLLLLPVGVVAALAAASAWYAPAVVLPVVALLALLQRDRTRYLDHALALREAFERSSDEARTDALTGLANRLAWDERTEQLAAGADAVVVVLADIDGLKAANDSLGHDAGDRLIVAVAEAVRAVRPSGALAARLGGDEFGLLLPVPSISDARAGERALTAGLNDRLDASPLIWGEIPVRASVGSAVAEAGHDLGSAMTMADQAVNQAKVTRGARRGLLPATPGDTAD